MKVELEIVRKYYRMEDQGMAQYLGRVSVEITTEQCFTNYRDKICNMNKKTQAFTKSKIKKSLEIMFTEIYGNNVKVSEIKSLE